jgi:hypothetical protein
MPPPMIATRATHAVRSICAFALLALAGCGGISVRHDEAASDDDAAGDDDTTQGGGRSSSKQCLALCTQCELDRLVGTSDCDEFCTKVDRQAVDAACGTLYDDLVRCRSSTANACSLTACPNQTNAFSVCVLTYCDSHSLTKPLCTAW